MNSRARFARLPMLALLLLAAAASPASAAPARPTGQEVAAKDVEPTTSASDVLANGADDEQAGCVRIRKRLWVGGEGWVVRSVTTCN